jgi:hypothetical protein
MGWCGLDGFVLGYGQMVGSFEHGNECLDFNKCGEFCD